MTSKNTGDKPSNGLNLTQHQDPITYETIGMLYEQVFKLEKSLSDEKEIAKQLERELEQDLNCINKTRESRAASLERIRTTEEQLKTWKRTYKEDNYSHSSAISSAEVASNAWTEGLEGVAEVELMLEDAKKILFENMAKQQENPGLGYNGQKRNASTLSPDTSGGSKKDQKRRRQYAFVEDYLNAE